MVKFYYRQVKEHGMPLEQVPERWREQVREMLEGGAN